MEVTKLADLEIRTIKKDGKGMTCLVGYLNGELIATVPNKNSRKNRREKPAPDYVLYMVRDVAGPGEGRLA